MSSRSWFPLVIAGVLGCMSNGIADTHRLITQSSSSDCGPAALATLLKFYLDVPTSESQIMKLADTNAVTGTSLAGLEAAATAKGCEAESFRMDYETLKAQLESFDTPVIVRMLNPEPHFVVVIGLKEKDVELADPAAGNILLRRKDFLKRWIIPGAKDGYVFIANAPDNHINKDNLAATRSDLERMRHALQTARFPIIHLTH